MTQHPSDALLLAATMDYLETQLLPTLAGEHRFKTRLAVNALKILQRSLNDLNNNLTDANTDSQQTLAETIRQKNVALDDPALLLTLERQLRQSLLVNHPKWLTD
jgi:tRNA uridine 5-carbamoylmethylation protein Kti12